MTNYPVSNTFSMFLLKRGYIEPSEEDSNVMVESPGTVQIHCNSGDHWLDTTLCDLMDPDIYLPDHECGINHILGLAPTDVKRLILAGKIRKVVPDEVQA